MRDYDSKNFRNNNDIREISWVWWWFAQLLTTVRFLYGWVILPVSLFTNLSTATPDQMRTALIVGVIIFLATELDGTFARRSRVVSAYPGIKMLGASFDYLADLPALLGIAGMGVWLLTPTFGGAILSILATWGEVLVTLLSFLS
ncbi:hypothetical protein KC721_04175 [Candidatus Woesebacteria bacterium]|nr:hypothetical protein [Candidatus Woesebacteria bacterium]